MGRSRPVEQPRRRPRFLARARRDRAIDRRPSHCRHGTALAPSRWERVRASAAMAKDEKSGRLTEGERIARAAKPCEDALRMHPFYRGKMQTLPKCAVRGLDDLAIWYSPGVAAPLSRHPRESRSGLRAHQQGELGGDRHGRHARARPRGRRAGGGPARHGGQGAPVQVPGRRGRGVHQSRDEGSRRDHPDGQGPRAGVRRHQPREHRPAQVLPHSRCAPPGALHPRVARRPAGHRHVRARRVRQRPGHSRQEPRGRQDRHGGHGRGERRELSPAHGERRRPPGHRRLR